MIKRSNRRNRLCLPRSSIPTPAREIRKYRSSRRIYFRRFFPSLPITARKRFRAPCELPRKGVRESVPRRTKLEYEAYPESEAGEGLPLGAEPVPNRWFIGFGRWKRYADPSTETPYQSGALRLWHPYLQSKLKGDAPIIGQDIFLNLTVSDFFQFETRRLPTPSGVSTARPNSSEFFGRSEQIFFSNDFSIGIDLFKGETAFKPVVWAMRLLGVYNYNYITLRKQCARSRSARAGFRHLRDPVDFVPGDPLADSAADHPLPNDLATALHHAPERLVFAPGSVSGKFISAI